MVFPMELSEKMRDEVVLHSWKMMKLERCKMTRGLVDNYIFPNGISVYWHYGVRPLKVISTVEQARVVESFMGDQDYKKKNKKGMIEFSVQYSNRGMFLDMLWNIYSIGNDWTL